MATPIKMPKFGMTMTEGTVVEWRFSLEDQVDKGKILLVIESEKAEIEVEATASGLLRHIYVEAGETVACGSLLAALTENAEESFDPDAFHKQHHTPKAAAPAPIAPAAAPPGNIADIVARTARKAVAPAARSLAQKLGLDLERIPGTGPGGRVTKADVKAWADACETLVEVAKGVRLEVPTLGDGDAVLLLPGFGTDVSAFAFQTPRLAEHYRVFGINPRGVGMSDAPDDGAYDPSLLAADACAVTDGPVHVIGASMGAVIALEMAIARPDKVRSLTLLTPAVKVSPRLRAILATWCELAAVLPAQTLARALLPWLFSDTTLNDEGVRLRIERGLAATLSRTPAAVLERYAAGLQAWAARTDNDLSRVEVPTLVLVAGDDLLIRGAQTVAESMPRARAVVVPGAGHALGLEAPEPVNAAILEHLAAVTAEQS